MKKILLFSVALFTMSANMLADGLTATLQQGDNMQAFYGVEAFKQAYEAASDGAVITLSSGQFEAVSPITKSITVIGAYAFSSNISASTVFNEAMSIAADSVHLEGIRWNDNLSLGKISDCHIKRCWVEKKLWAFDTHTNTLIDQCVVKTDEAIANGINYSIKNSTLEKFGAMNTKDNMANITNCVIWGWTSIGYSGNSAIGYRQPYGIYKNNLLKEVQSYKPSFTTDSYSEFYHNIFSWYSNVTFPSGIDGGNIVISGNATSSNGIYPAGTLYSTYNTAGMDGTAIGTYGGSGFSAYPSIPRITSRTIDSFTDAEGKLNVKIKAVAEQ